MMVPLLGQSPAVAADLPQGVSDVRVGLIHLGSALAAAAEQPALSDDLPLTDTSVRDILSLDTAIGTLVDDALSSDSDTTLDTLDEAFPEDGPLTVQEVDRSAGAPAGSREWTMKISFQAAQPVALAYQDPAKRLELGTAALGGDVAASLDATVRFRYDPDAIDLRTFSVVGSTALTAHVWTSDDGTERGADEVDIPGFTVVDGFVELDASGSATIDSTTVLTLRDPNGRGQITTEDFEFSSASDLFTTTEAPGKDDVSMDIDLSTPMEGTATGSISVGERADATTTYAAPRVTRSAALDDLSSLTRLQAITGFTQYTSALQSVEASVDQQFPLLDLSLSDLFSPAQQMVDLLTEQATASIVCGAADTSPPTGAPRPGQVRYCQASTSGFEPKAGETITWTSPDDGVEITRSGEGTVGRTPTANVVVAGGNGFPSLRVGFTAEDGTKRFARSAVTSIQGLGRAIDRMGLDGDVDYDPTKQSLQIAVRNEDSGSAKQTVPTGGNGNLAPLTGLSGLCQAATSSNPRECRPTGDTPSGGVVTAEEGSATVEVDGRSFTADFGIGLVEAGEPVEGQPAPAEPTFYLRPGEDGLVYQVDSATASLAEDGQMVARIGFLQVDVDVSDYSVSQTGKAASISVPTGTVDLPSDETVDDAVTLAGLLAPSSDPDDAPTVERGLTAKATLAVQDSAQDAAGKRPVGADGTVKAAWNSLLPSALPAVTTEGDYDRLRLLDVVPARQGTMGSGTGNGVIKDPGASFLEQFGLTQAMTDEESTVTRPLYDLGVPGSSSTVCSQFVVKAADELLCTEGPLAEAGVVAEGHPYVVDGDQDALRDIVIEDLAAVLNSFTTPDPSLGADRTFPLVDVLPTEISAARDGLGKAIGGVQDLVEKPDASLGVSTMQELAGTLDTLLGRAVGGRDSETARTLAFSLTTSGTTRLVLESSLATKGTRDAPLRVAAQQSEVKVTDVAGEVSTLPVDVTSKAKFVIGVDLADASSQVRADSGVAEQITTISGGAAELARVKNTLQDQDADYGSARVKTGAADDIEVGIGVNAVTSPKGSDDTWIDIAALPTEMEQVRSVAGAPQTCGGTAPDPSKVAACLELPIVSTPATAPVMVALEADQSSGGSGGSMKDQPIAYRFLAEALGGLNLTLADGLDGDQTLDEDTGAPLSLPLVGTNLDAGADVVADVDRYVSTVRTALKGVESVGKDEAASKLGTDLKAALGTVTTQLASKNLTAPAGTVVLDCAGSCDGKKVGDVQKISVPVVLTGALPDPKKVPFQAGPAGSTIVSDLEVPVKTTWTLKVTVGIGRGTGPFVKLGEATAADPLLKVDVEAQLPKYDKAVCHSWSRQTTWENGLKPAAERDIKNVDVPADGSTDAECIDAYVGKFPSVMVDREKDGERGTFLDASVVVDVTAPDGTGADGLVYLPTLYDKSATFETTASGDGSISTYFESFAGQAGFFDVVGTIDLAWKDGAYTDDGLQYGLLKIDVGSLNKAVFPGFKKALAWTAPLNPVVDQLAKPIPVVTNLSELVGQGPVTLLTLLQKKNTPINLIVNLLQMQNIAAKEPEGTTDLRDIGTGGLQGFKVSPFKLGVGGKCTETGTADGKPFERKNGGKGASGRCKLGNFDKMKQYVKGEKPEKDPAGLKIDKTVTRSPYLSLPSVSVPVLQDTSQIFSLLQDTGDATMLYVDLGHAGVSGQIVRRFGPFAVGPIPVTASIGGTVGLDGRFAFGFDTRGLSKRIETLDTGDISGFDDLIEDKPSLFSDGFYIDDLEKGVDVPEIQLTFTVQAGAAISIGIVEAGISGGATLDLSLDAFDPNGDGKIYTDEFAGTSNGPACAFNVSSGISFFLQFYFTIEFVFYTFSKSFDIARSPRLKLFEFNCKTDTPTLAVERKVDGKDSLVLTMGTAANERKGFDGEKAEKYTVRQIGAPRGGEITLQVSAFNLVENHTVPEGTVIRADGADGSDMVRLYPMPDVTTNDDNEPQMLGPGDDGYVPPTFSAGAVVKGGSGSDTIETSDGDDVVDGDDGNGGADGNDVIRTGAGDDVLRGGLGLDQLDGGQGSDVLSGGGDDDRLNGGPGADELRGGDGDDVLDGGIGASPEGLFPVATAAAIRPLLDSGDLVVGDDGADAVDGGDGSDIVVGGSYDDAPAAFTDTSSITVSALDANRKILSVVVDDVATVKSPSDAELRQQCGSPGEAGEVGPDVVTGGNDRDYVIGGAGSDTLAGGGGDDVVCGRGGDDLLDGDGSDVDVSLQGDDVVRGGPGRDRLYGSAGKDDLNGDADDDLVRGGDGADKVVGGAGSDLLLGEAGIDTVDGDNAAGDPEVDADPADGTSSGRSIVCSTSTSVVGGGIDLDGDLAGNDDGQLEGMSVVEGVVQDPVSGTFTGIVGGVVFVDGLADLDGSGTIEPRTKSALGDTGSVPLAGITRATGNGDCVLGGDEVDTRLTGGAGADYVDAGGGDDTNVHGGTGDDLVRGGEGDDTVHGDAGDDLVAGDAGDDVLFGNADDDVLRGGSGRDLAAGGSNVDGAQDGADEVLGDGGDDVVLGGNATLSRVAIDDTAIDGVGVTLLTTPVVDGSDDQVFGGVGDDWVFAQEGDDQAYGGPGRDVVEGGPGSDRVQGDDDEDLLVGGSSTTGAVTTDRSASGADDGDDTVVGDEGVDSKDGSDVMTGDNAVLQIDADTERSRWQRVRNDVSIALSDDASDDANGDDTMRGGGADDLILGQDGDDVVDAGAGDDAVEGGAGQDTVHGDAGDDEILGGSWTEGSVDDEDTLHGDEGDDLVLGDNGNPANGSTPYVRLHDVPAPGTTAPAAVSGGDVITGGLGDDRMFGQGGGDTVTGGAGVDVLEGGAGIDRMSGGADDDVLTGGSSSRDGVISPDRTGAGQLDTYDVLAGDGGNDVLAGDNARLETTNARRGDGTRARGVLLFDLATATAKVPGGVGGGDTLSGGDGRDLVFGQTGNDAISGNAGDDYLEGNDGADSLVGGAGEDDVVGGGSANNGAVISVFGPLVIDRLLMAPTGTTDVSAAGLLDGNDVLDGGDARDVLLGDNGRITRSGPSTTLAGGASGTHVVRQVAMADKKPGVWSGSDRLIGGAGDDDLYGQLDNTGTKRTAQGYLGAVVPGDVLIGGLGDDAMVGDQGIDVPTPAAKLGAVGRTLKDKKSFVREVVRPRGTLVRVVTLTQARLGGDDLILGDAGADSIHAGAGKDVVNAGSGDDVVFAGDGADAIWGGLGHDRLFGGAGNDLLDVKRRAGEARLRVVAAPVEDTDRRRKTVNGRDVLYGGSGADALQADQGDGSVGGRRVQGDRLIDWRAKVNAFATCRTGAATGKIMSSADSSMVKTLRELAKASGAVGSSELAIPSNERITKYPGRPGMVCDTR